MTALAPVTTDPTLGADIVAHLEAQLVSARRLLAIVLEQGGAIRRRDVHNVVQLAGMLQAELQKRYFIEQDRTALLDRAGRRLGIHGAGVTLELLTGVMDAATATVASRRSLELRGMLAEIKREHSCNRALMTQELAFLDHLLKLADQAPGSAGYDAPGERPAPAQRLLADHQPVFDLSA
jgi:hypothetical protein